METNKYLQSLRDKKAQDKIIKDKKEYDEKILKVLESIDSKDTPVDNTELLKDIKQLLIGNTKAIKEIKIPEPKETVIDLSEVVGVLKEIRDKKEKDNTDIINAIKEIKIEIPEPKDYTPILKQIITGLSKLIK